MNRADRERRALELRDHIARLMPLAHWTDGAIVQTSDNECYVSTLVTLPSGERFRVDVEYVDQPVEDVERGRVADLGETGSGVFTDIGSAEGQEGREKPGFASDPVPVRGPRLDDDPPSLLAAYDHATKPGRR